jgi:hypothetical protein
MLCVKKTGRETGCQLSCAVVYASGDITVS